MSVTIYVPDLPEFAPLLKAARAVDGCAIAGPSNDYWTISAGQAIDFNRKALGIGPALWNSALTGGFRGEIIEFNRDWMRIRSAN